MRTRSFIPIHFALTAILLPAALQAQWTHDTAENTPVSTATFAQQSPAVSSDGGGGVIVAWRDYRSNTNNEVYAQRMSAGGVALWTADGVPLRSLPSNVLDVVAVSDGAGGAIVAWTDSRNPSPDVFVQRVDADGALLWTTNGVAVCTASGVQDSLSIVPDGSGGAVIAWLDLRAGSDVYAQRVDASGSVLWTANGVLLTTGPASFCRFPSLVTDGAGGAIVAWQEDPGSITARVQRVDASGAALWTGGGVILNTPNPSTDVEPLIAVDGAGGAVVFWIQLVGSPTHIFAQRVDPSGAALWTPLGEDLGAEDKYYEPSVAWNGRGQVVYMWNDDIDMDAAAVDTSGSVTFFRVASDLSDVGYPGIISTGDGSWTAIWGEFTPGPDEDIRATAFGASGDSLWGPRAVASHPSEVHAAVAVTDIDSGIIVTWQDYRGGFSQQDIYAQRILGDGSVPTTYSGKVYHDLLADGDLDPPGDSALAGRTIYLLDGGGPIDSTTTPADGRYAFTPRSSGDYRITQALPADWYQITPSTPDTFTFTYQAGDDDARFLDFGDVFGYRYIGPEAGNWSVPSNWTGGTVPNAGRIAVVPTSITVDALPDDTVKSLLVLSAGVLTFTSGAPDIVVSQSVIIREGGGIVYPGSTATGPASAGRDGATAVYTLICHGNWVNEGGFDAGASTVTMAGDSALISGSTEFGNLVISGAGVHTGPTTPSSDPERALVQSVAGDLVLERSLNLRDADTVVVLNDDPGAIVDTGLVPRGTLVRAIEPGSTAAYRFESPLTTIAFDGGGTNPASMAVTAVPDTIPTAFSLEWLLVGGTPNAAANTVTADSVSSFSRWALGRPKLTSLGTPEVERIYAIEPSGGSEYLATVQLRYEDAEVFGGVAEADLRLMRGPFTVDTVDARWNLLSVPLVVRHFEIDSVFPGAISAAYGFGGGGYQTETILGNGRGYWLKYGADAPVSAMGETIDLDTIDLEQGWNLVGSISTPLAAASVGSVPPGLVVSGFFGYDAGYVNSDTIRPGKGYWVKAEEDGKLVLSAGAAADPASRLVIRRDFDSPPPPPAGDGPAEAPAGGVPSELSLAQNYPNPFNPSTAIRYELPSRGRVTLRVYDLLGSEVATLVDETQEAGAKAVTWDASSSPAGVYYCRISSGGRTVVRAMLLLK